MPQKVKLFIKGRYTNPNSMSEVPEGALSVADNLVIDRESVAELRRGFKQYGSPLTSPKKLFNFSNKLIAHAGTTFYYDADDAGTWTSLSGTYDTPLSGQRVQAVQANQNLYLTTDKGVIKLGSPSGTLASAGAPRGLDTQVSLTGSGSSQPVNSQRAYRIVWGTTDANSNLVLGSPGSRKIVINPSAGADSDTTVAFTVPTGLTTSWFYQIYRSLPSLTDALTPDDELFLVVQKNLTSSNISAGTVTFNDSLQDSMLGAFLYTDSTQDGILDPNDRPPFATDIALFSNHTFYVSTKTYHQIILTMLVTPTGGDTITIDGVVYTADATETISTRHFKTFSTGAPETDIPNTLDSLIRVINRNAANTTNYAYQIDDTNFYLEARTFTSSYTATCSRATVFSQVVPITSSNNASNNRLHVSKEQQPEAVPFLSSDIVGRADKKTLRIIALRDALMILREDGVFRLTGTDRSNFVIDPVDTTVELIGAETAVRFGEAVYCCTTEGMVAFSVSGKMLIGRPIEAELRKTISLSNFAPLSWSAAYEGDRKFIIGVPDAPTSPDITYLHVFNNVTNAWTRWPLQFTHALVSERDKKLYAIRLTDGQVLQERKDFTVNDYADDQYTFNVTVVAGNLLTVDSVTGLVADMTLVQDGKRALVTLVDVPLKQVTISSATAWDTGSTIAYTPIEGICRWAEEYASSPGQMKHWIQAIFLFEKTKFSQIKARFATELSPGYTTTILSPRNQGQWGKFPWGRLPWGRGLGLFQPLRTFFPRSACRSLWANIELRMKATFSNFALVGCTLDAEVHQVTRFK